MKIENLICCFVWTVNDVQSEMFCCELKHLAVWEYNLLCFPIFSWSIIIWLISSIWFLHCSFCAYFSVVYCCFIIHQAVLKEFQPMFWWMWFSIELKEIAHLMCKYITYFQSQFLMSVFFMYIVLFDRLAIDDCCKLSLDVLVFASSCFWPCVDLFSICLNIYDRMYCCLRIGEFGLNLTVILNHLVSMIVLATHIEPSFEIQYNTTLIQHYTTEIIQYNKQIMSTRNQNRTSRTEQQQQYKDNTTDI